MMLNNAVSSLLVLFSFVRKSFSHSLLGVARKMFQYRYWYVRILSSAVVLLLILSISLTISGRWNYYDNNRASNVEFGIIFGYMGLIVFFHILKKVLEFEDDSQVLAVVIGINAVYTISRPLMFPDQGNDDTLYRFLGESLGLLVSYQLLQFSKAITKETEWFHRESD